MKIRALKRLAGSYGLLDKGVVIDLPNYVANDLIASDAADEPAAKGRRKRGSR
jgi:hypothetical protein